MKSAYPLVKRIIVISLILTLCVGFDQVSKQWAAQHLSTSLSTPYLNGLIRLEYAENSGTFSSIGIGLSDAAKFWLFVVAVGLALLCLLLYLLVSEQVDLSLLIGGALVVGGGLSNVLDRLLHGGRVIDFVFFVIGDRVTDIFNLADLAITVGVIVMLFVFLGRWRTQSE